MFIFGELSCLLVPQHGIGVLTAARLVQCCCTARGRDLESDGDEAITDDESRDDSVDDERLQRGATVTVSLAHTAFNHYDLNVVSLSDLWFVIRCRSVM